jgi:hypothetical protein
LTAALGVAFDVAVTAVLATALAGAAGLLVAMMILLEKFKAYSRLISRSEY